MPDAGLTRPEQIARDCGLRLLQLSAVYESAVVPYDAPEDALIVATLVTRQRRFLRAAFLLADTGQRLEASIMVRTMLEYLIQQKWLAENPQLNYLLWMVEDLEMRLCSDLEVGGQHPDGIADELEVMAPEVRASVEEKLEMFRERLDVLALELGLPDVPRYPTMRDQAREVGLGYTYSLARRFDRSSGFHPTLVALEQFAVDADADTGWTILQDRPVERLYVDPYTVGAFMLSEALACAARRLPQLHIEGFDETVALLETVTP